MSYRPLNYLNDELEINFAQTCLINSAKRESVAEEVKDYYDCLDSISACDRSEFLERVYLKIKNPYFTIAHDCTTLHEMESLIKKVKAKVESPEDINTTNSILKCISKENEKYKNKCKHSTTQHKIIDSKMADHYKFETETSLSSENEALPCINKIYKEIDVFLKEPNFLNEEITENYLFNLTGSDFEKCWEEPVEKDLESMKSIYKYLNSGDKQNLNYTFNFLPEMIKDFPAEFFLQPPFLYVCLGNLLKNELIYSNALLDIFFDLVEALLNRIKFRRTLQTYCYNKDGPKKRVCQLSLSRFVLDVFMLVTDYMRKFVNQNTSNNDNKCFQILSVLNELMEYNHHITKQNIFGNLNKLGSLIEMYRLACRRNSKEPLFNIRANYFNALRILNDLLSKLQIKNDSLPCMTNNLWLSELKGAMFDVSFKVTYPLLYQSIMTNITPFLNEDDQIIELISSGEKLLPVIQILRKPQSFSNTDILLKSFHALDTINIWQCRGYTKLIMNAICSHCYEDNEHLTKCAEKLLLKLVSNPNDSIKLFAYELSALAIKEYVGKLSISESMGTRRKTIERETSTSNCFIGIPITTEFLIEIIRFGNYSTDQCIKQYSRHILDVLLKSRKFLFAQWKKLKEIIIAVMPMLECIIFPDNLGDTILQILSPDNDDINDFDLLKSNIRLLFFCEPHTRNEALNRVIYFVTRYINNERNSCLPNMNNINGTLTNNICILSRPYKFVKQATRDDDFVRMKLPPIMCTLKNHTLTMEEAFPILNRLNILIDDPNLCNDLFEENWWPYVLKFWYDSLSSKSECSSAELIQTCVSICLKLALNTPQFRNCIAQDKHFLYLTLRSLFLYHRNYYFKTICVSLLFTMLYDDFIIKIGGVVSLPSLLLVSKAISIPYVCSFHDEIINRMSESTLEFILNGGNQDYKTKVQEYLRILLAVFWVRKTQGIPIELLKDDHESYLHISSNSITDFNRRLKLISHDIDILKATDVKTKLDYYVTEISYTEEYDVALSYLGEIENLILLPICKEYELLQKILKAFKKFIQNAPNSISDNNILINIMRLLGNVFEAKNWKSISWLPQYLETNNSIINTIKQKNNVREQVFFDKCVDFLSIMLQDKTFQQLPTQLFHIIFRQFGNKRALKAEEIRGYISLMSSIPFSSIEMDMNLCEQVVDFLVSIMLGFKCATQSGSNLIIKCLLIVEKFLGYLLKSVDFMKEKYLSLFVSLCSHINLTVRALSWNVLSVYCETQNGAKNIIEKMSYFPGGFHACVLSTIVDVEECSLVKSAATKLFLQLIHCNLNPDQLLRPYCKNEYPPNTNKTPEIILDIVKSQRFCKNFIKNLQHLSFCPITKPKLLSDADTIVCFCLILKNLIALQILSINSVDKDVLPQLMKLLIHIPKTAPSPVLIMYTEISCLIYGCLKQQPDLYYQLIGQNIKIIVGLFNLLSIKSSESGSKDEIIHLHHKVINVLISVTKDKVGFQNICSSFSNINLMEFSVVIINGIGAQVPEEFQEPYLQLIYLLLRQSKRVKLIGDDISFAECLEKTYCNSINKNMPDYSKNTQICSLSELLFYNFYLISDKFSTKIYTFTNKTKLYFKTLDIFLQTSEKARECARGLNFIQKIISMLKLFQPKINKYNCISVVRAGKNEIITKKLIVLYGIVHDWYSHNTFTDKTQITDLLDVFYKLWYWNSLNEDLEMKVCYYLQCCTAISADFCKEMMKKQTGYTESLFSIILKVISESSKFKNSKTRKGVLYITLKIMTNCSKVIEGRILLCKCKEFIQTIQSFYPGSIKDVHMKRVVEMWLEFWSGFTKFPEGISACSIKTFFSFITYPKNCRSIKLIALKIVRHYIYSEQLRGAILNSDEFKEVISLVLDSKNYTHINIVLSMILKLSKKNFKNKQLIKNGNIRAQLSKISSNLELIKQDTDVEKTRHIIKKINDNL